MALLEDQIEEAQAAFLAAHEAKDTAGAQALADHVRSLQAQKATLDQTATESSQAGTDLRNPMIAAGAGALAGAVVNPVRGAVHNIITPQEVKAPPKMSAPAPSSLSGQLGQGGENWTKSLTGVDVPNAQMNKGSLDTAQRMAATVGRGGELAGGRITESGIMLPPDRNAKPAAPAPRTMASQATQAGKSLLQGVAGDPQPMSPFSIVKGGTRGAITGAALADIPQQIAQGNYGTAAADTGISVGNILHGLARTPKGKALGTLLGLGSGVTRTVQGVNELTGEQKAKGGLVHLAGGGLTNALTQTAINTPLTIAPSAASMAKNAGKGAYAPAIEDAAALALAMAPLNPLTAAMSFMVPSEAGAGSTRVDWEKQKAAEAAARQRAQKQFEQEEFMRTRVGVNAPKFLQEQESQKVRNIPKFSAGKEVLKAGANLAKKSFASKPQKFSEAIEPFIGTHSLHPTIVDKTKLDLAAGRMAGPEAPYLQEISQPHKESGWIFANDSLGAASKLYNMGKDNKTLVTGLLGSPTQLKTNRSVFGEIADEYFKAIKEGKMTPELQAKIQARLPTLRHGKENIQTFPTQFDIRDRDAFNEMATGFHQRGHLADIMGGKGVSQGLPRGTGKIIPYEDILMRNTEESLIGAPTHSIGSRLFTVGSKPPEYRPDLHNAFDYANFGELKSGHFGYVPKEVGYPDEIARIKANLASRGIGRDITAMDLMRNTINQPITEQMWRRAQAEGFAPGGKVLSAIKKMSDEAQAAYKAKFTPGFYHASPANDITAFDSLKSPKGPEKVTPGVTFAARNPNFSNSILPDTFDEATNTVVHPFAPGSTVYPVNINMSNHFDPKTKEGQAVLADFVKQKYLSGENPNKKAAAKFLTNISDPHSNWTTMEGTDFLDHLKNTGHKSFEVRESGFKNVGVFDPTNIRGKFAKFNPEDAADPDFMKAEGGPVQHFQAGKRVLQSGLDQIAKLARHPHGQDPKVAQALEEYLKGNISQEERIRIANQFLPIRQWNELPPNYTDEQIRNALTSDKQAKALAPVPTGMRVGNRLDIPAYTRQGVYVDTTHDAATGKAISYGRTGHLKDVEFYSSPDTFVRVGLGTKPQALTPMGAVMGTEKTPKAQIKGIHQGTPDDEVRRMMEEMMKDPRYTQIGMDPRKHSQFYDKSTGMPVFSAEEKLQSGPLILAPKKGLETTSWDDPRLNLSDFLGKQYAAGGSVFDPQGSDYDYQTALAYGMGPTGLGDNQGHWGSVAPVSDDEQQLHDLPSDSYVVLKGKSHPTFHKAKVAENERGSEIVKKGDRYYSVPKK
jgi:hypothetical protein